MSMTAQEFVDAYRGREVRLTSMTYHWSVEDLELVEPESSPTQSIKCYPNTCPKCKSPARVRSGLVICSVIKCKANRPLRKRLFVGKPVVAKAQINEGRDGDGYLICPTCGLRAYATSGWLGKCDANELVTAHCSPYNNKHTWEIIVRVGDKIFQGGRAYSAVIYENGNRGFDGLY